MTRGERIKKRRLDLGMSQVELAEKIGESKQSIYKYESGIVTNIPLPNVEKIASALDVTIDWLCWGTEKEKVPELSETKKELIEIIKRMSEEDAVATLRILRR